METTATGTAQNAYGVGALINNHDPLSHGVLIVLALMSFFSWYIIATKLWDQRKLSSSYKAVEKTFWTSPSLKDGVERLKKGDSYRAIVEEGLRAAAHHDGRLTDRIDLHEWITMSLQRSVANVNGTLQSGLGFLATVGSTAPFVGLFGTVVGIIKALIAIGVSGQPSIDRVAGPVGEALIMTAFGLLVAVPAVLGYNWLVSRNKGLQENLRNFAADVHAYLVGGARVGGTDAPRPAAAAAAPAAAVRK
ncbi:MAG TPA: MotA/TolQ/ExbB proton channel family protein [Steroidobacteraceae bacterium]|nr:MotA/TolQ/ExbB proton channel family protein [Steroidobacteraceae bacterium]HUO36450.1 MotA/TolQ/ExbB proton channel family protein [Mycobacterium sp.]